MRPIQVVIFHQGFREPFEVGPPSNPSKRRREGSTEPPEATEVSHRISSLCASHDGHLIACGRDSGGRANFGEFCRDILDERFVAIFMAGILCSISFGSYNG